MGIDASPDVINEGDTIALSVRKTPMTVIAVEEHPTSKAVVRARNRYGEYRLRYYSDETWSLWVSGQLDATGDELSVEVISR